MFILFFSFSSLCFFSIFTYYISQCQTHSNEDKTSFLLFSHFLVNIAASWWAMCFLLLRRGRWVRDTMALMIFLEYCAFLFACFFFSGIKIFVILIISEWNSYKNHKNTFKNKNPLKRASFERSHWMSRVA